MKRKLMFLSLAAIGLASCNGGFKQGDGGLLYNIHTSKGGAKIKEGDFISLNMVVKTDGDSVLNSTYESGQPTRMAMPKPQAKGDVVAGIGLLGEGDSATFKIASDSIFKGGQQRPPGFKSKYLVFVVKVEKVIAKGNLNEQVFRGRVMDYIKSQGDALKAQEPAKIKKYIDDNHLKLEKTASGLQYVITTPGTGAKPAVGDTAVVNYTGKMVSGKVFDTSIKAEATKAKIPVDPMRQFAPIRIPVGQGKVIPGWDEGLQLLNKGAKAIFIIPSDIAYKDQGIGPIGPYSPLVFEMEMVDVVKPNPNAPKPVVPQLTPPPAK
ncbi:FKBP-type peptidyl-prolyl cis-trans isomerase [Mucilaginibacter lappiensis]|uniref:peptidylprolyl isomerase n=1 Tax=Mucilaginibacter lappiensis TaxID=354630 RepID=A0ABR6PP80_9SPHI|nr:FKBP-type peptidyl-prolyl cis-trans isomerase [Mucilaginibacter lappiensis]MBB6111574.1 FKBP-type peptidyl-prolyl cis-trans isomerase [Mucilaginibacter lappiensis]SIR85253.1 FKBP-type peptidyl-prolyl cis-trans isomerase [Mucilaginibacter lappiensis]